jgi:hypothetical protein
MAGTCNIKAATIGHPDKSIIMNEIANTNEITDPHQRKKALVSGKEKVQRLSPFLNSNYLLLLRRAYSPQKMTILLWK